jgi:hypothetical protein
VAELQANLAVLSAQIDRAVLADVRRILAPWHNRPWQSGLAENN